MTGHSKGAERNPAATADKSPGKTDGSLEGAELKPLRRPVNSDGFLIDRPLSPEEEGLAGPLPEGKENRGGKPGG